MKSSRPPQRTTTIHQQWTRLLDGLAEPDRDGLSAEVEAHLSGRIRDIRLTGRLEEIHRETSWRQRSRISRGWLTWAMLLSCPMIILDWMFLPSLLQIAILMKGPFLLATLGSLLWVWSRPRAEWIEDATLPVTVAALMTIGGVLGMVGGGQSLHQYLAAGIFAASTAIVIFPVRLSATIVGTMIAIGAYVGIGLFDAVAPVHGMIAFALFFALVLGALVLSRHTMSILQQHAFLLNLRGIMQTRALARANARLAVLAHTDALTGLPNRRAYEEEARRLWADPSDPPRSLGVVLFDIDHFKRLNDTAGHGVGDRCLAAVAAEILPVVPDGGLCARYGGEEFICILSDATPRGVLRFAETVRATVEALAWPNPGIGRSVTVSLGVAVGTTDRRLETLAALVGAADAALYRAKSDGRNRIATAWDPPSEDAAAAPPAPEPLCA